MCALFCLFLCSRSYPEKLEVYIPKFYKIRYILHELYVAVIWIISQLIICIDQLNTATVNVLVDPLKWPKLPSWIWHAYLFPTLFEKPKIKVIGMFRHLFFESLKFQNLDGKYCACKTQLEKEIIYLGTIHLRRRHFLGGTGQKSWKFADVLNGWSLFLYR